jgi:acetyl esterase/lipase
MKKIFTRRHHSTDLSFLKDVFFVRSAVAISILMTSLLSFNLSAQEIIWLYPDTIPNSIWSRIEEDKTLPADGMYRNIKTPTLEVYLPAKEKSTGAAVIICPGGGYSVLVYQGEGITTAKELAKNGLTAFVLKYRLPHDSQMLQKGIGPLQDAQQAIKLVRENADKWGVDKTKIGIMGFSAGGHLASSAATQFDHSFISNPKNTSLRPDFQILVYPVISMQDNLTHIDSRKKLLGPRPSKHTIDLFSNELQVKETSPAAYITHAADDKLVDVDNSIVYFNKLRHLRVPAALHIYPKGDHGFIFRNKEWMHPLIGWLKENTWMKH